MEQGVYLKGVENNMWDNSGQYFNWLLSNGDKSQSIDEGNPTDKSFMMPEEAHEKIRSVELTYDGYIVRGFQFFDKDKTLLWKAGDLGYAWEGYTVATVSLEENEAIIGIVAKLAFAVFYKKEMNNKKQRKNKS